MRAMDLALYADVLAGKAAALSARLERARASLRQAAVERDARAALEEPTLARLERLGVLGSADPRGLRKEVFELAADLSALRELQAWTEACRHEERERTASANVRAAIGEELHADARPRMSEREAV